MNGSRSSAQSLRLSGARRAKFRVSTQTRCHVHNFRKASRRDSGCLIGDPRRSPIESICHANLARHRRSAHQNWRLFLHRSPSAGYFIRIGPTLQEWTGACIRKLGCVTSQLQHPSCAANHRRRTKYAHAGGILSRQRLSAFFESRVECRQRHDHQWVASASRQDATTITRWKIGFITHRNEEEPVSKMAIDSRRPRTDDAVG